MMINKLNQMRTWLDLKDFFEETGVEHLVCADKNKVVSCEINIFSSMIPMLWRSRDEVHRTNGRCILSPHGIRDDFRFYNIVGPWQ
jgi:hypothetical protein